MKEYNKINAIFNRDTETKKTVANSFRDPSVEYLKNCLWDFTEKVDGTNIRIHWDGHKVEFGGRTDNAAIPAPLVNKLNEMFGGPENEEIFEQKFNSSDVILYGEGYGKKIQKGGLYIPDDVSFILFDVEIGDIYLKREAVEDIAHTFNIDVVPIVWRGTIKDGIKYVMTHPKSTLGVKKADMEGVVGRPQVEMLDRMGRRIITKIKWNDFKDFTPEDFE